LQDHSGAVEGLGEHSGALNLAEGGLLAAAASGEAVTAAVTEQRKKKTMTATEAL
jgi:hypothetical protein